MGTTVNILSSFAAIPEYAEYTQFVESFTLPPLDEFELEGFCKYESLTFRHTSVPLKVKMTKSGKPNVLTFLQSVGLY